MYNQLASWMVYGILQDQHGEFFIRRYYVSEFVNLLEMGQFAIEIFNNRHVLLEMPDNKFK